MPADCSHPFDQRSRKSLDIPSSSKWSKHPGTIGAWVAEADFGTAPAVTEALHHAVDAGVFGYLATPLADELSDAAADFFQESYGWQVSPERVHHVSDVLAGLRIATRFVTPGSPVIVPTPAYMPVLTLLPGTVVDGRWQHDLDAIDGAFGQGAELLFLCNPHNPTGTVLTRAELRALADVVERHDGRVFADEIHAPLRFDGAQHVPYATVSEAAPEHTITATSTSKAWNLPGLKAAQVILTNESDQRRYLDEELGEPYGAATLGVVAAIAAYRDGRDWLADTIDYLADNRTLLATALAEHAPQISWQPNEATYLAWLDLGREVPDAAARLLDAGVAITPGAACGVGYDRFIRVTYATPKPVLAEAIERIGGAL